MATHKQPEPSPLPIVQEKKETPFWEQAAKLLNNQAKIEQVLKLVWEDGYSKGISHMDKMHGEL